MAVELTDEHRALIRILATAAVEQFCDEADNLQLNEEITHNKKRPRLESLRDDQGRLEKGKDNHVNSTRSPRKEKAPYYR